MGPSKHCLLAIADLGFFKGDKCRRHEDRGAVGRGFLLSTGGEWLFSLQKKKLIWCLEKAYFGAFWRLIVKLKELLLQSQEHVLHADAHYIFNK